MNIRLLALSIALLSSALFPGCASSLHIYRDAPNHVISEGNVVYVTNPESTQELAILRNSGIYHITAHPEGAIRLTLLPLRQYGRCANPLMLSIFTFGLVPGYLPGAFEFSYKVETEQGEITFHHRLPIYERFSVWERLIHQDRALILGNALAHSQREQTPNKASEPTTMSVTPPAAQEPRQP